METLKTLTLRCSLTMWGLMSLEICFVFEQITVASGSTSGQKNKIGISFYVLLFFYYFQQLEFHPYETFVGNYDACYAVTEKRTNNQQQAIHN